MMMANKKTSNSSTHSIDALIETVKANNPQEVQRLLNAGIDPNHYEDPAKVTPLHFAAQANAWQSAMVLLQAGAKVNAETADGLTPLNVAQMGQHIEMTKVLSGDVS